MYPFLNVLISFLITMISIFTLSGCGGGGGGGSSAPKFLAVKSVTPVDGTNGVDARVASIDIKFASQLDPSQFVKEGVALSTLFSGSAEREQIKIKNNKTNAIVSASTLTLADLKSGQYSAIRYNSDGTEFYLFIDSYSFFQEANGGYGLKIDLRGTDNDIVFSAAEVTNDKLLNSNLIKVQGGPDLETAYGQVVVDHDTIHFFPVNYLKWSTKYTVTVDQSVKDMTYGIKLEKNFISTFTTTKQPDAVIATANPLGSQASPIDKIYAIPNFKVTGAVSASNVALYKVSRVASDDPNPIRTQLDVNATYVSGTNTIAITPVRELEYTQEYQVIVKAGLSGTLGSAPVNLPIDYSWTFTTGPISLISHSPSGAYPDDPLVDPEDSIYLDFNFRPSDSSILAGVKIVNLSRGTSVNYVVTSNSDGHVVLKPTSKLSFANKYQVTVLPAVISATNSNVHLDQAAAFSFTTEQRKILSVAPANDQKNVDENSKIQVKLNFVPINAEWNDPSRFLIEQQVNGGSWKKVTGYTDFGIAGPKLLQFSPDSAFLFNAKIRVTITGQFLAEDGQPVSNPQSITFTVRNDEFLMTSSSPKEGASYVMLNEEISAYMSDNIDVSTVYSDSIKVVEKNCGYSSSVVPGKTYVFGNELYFVPSRTLKSNCTHMVTVDSGVQGVNNRKQERTQFFSFTTDYLRVDSIYVDYAYSDLVSVYSTIELKFNYPLGYLYSNDIYLLNMDTGIKVYGSLYSHGDTAEFSSYDTLDYGTEYAIVVTSDTQGSNGEKLIAEDRTYFVTENLPLDVSDYGPTGIVYIDDIFWVDMNYPASRPGFPGVTGDLTEYFSANSTFTDSATVTTDGGYTVYLTPNSYLQHSTDYDVNYHFNFGYGSSSNFDFTWPVLSEDNYVGILSTPSDRKTIQSVTSNSATAMTKVSPMLSTPERQTKALSIAKKYKSVPRLQRLTKSIKAERGCRNNVACFGHLRTRNIEGYKKVIAARTRANIVKVKDRAQLQELKKHSKRVLGRGRR